MNRLFMLPLIMLMYACATSTTSTTEWTNPIRKQGRLGSPLVEVTPFTFNGRLYLLENNQRFWDVEGAKPGDFFHEDVVRIRDVETGELVTTALTNHAFGTALVCHDTVYVFAGNYGEDKPWRQITSITMTASGDLKSWTEPVTVVEAAANEYFFNTAVTKGAEGYALLYETNDPTWPPFTFRYVKSDDLRNWEEIPGAVYGVDKYVGGPALYYEGDWYYTLYLDNIGTGWVTRIARSKDLVNWEDAKPERPFIAYDTTHTEIPLLDPTIRENNASDVELCYFNGKSILYFTGSDQSTAGDLQWATFDGTPRELFEYFFEEEESKSRK